MRRILRNKVLRYSLIGGGLALLFISGTTYGLLVGKYQIFPYTLITSMQESIVPYFKALEKGRTEAVLTKFFPLEKKIFRFSTPSLEGYGGGIAYFDQRIIGVDRKGVFFIYSLGGHVELLNISAPTNRDSFLKYLTETLDSTLQQRKLERNFRVLDIVARENNGLDELYISYYYWHEEEAAKSVRIARLQVDRIESYVMGSASHIPEGWEVIYESTPLLRFDDKTRRDNSPFNINHSGGKMNFDSLGHLIVGLGDHYYEGIHEEDLMPSDSSEFGKVFSIDPETGATSLIARGFRSPGGLHIDVKNNLWVADHGPEAGCELNLVEKGGHYGWPYVTYGTDYGSFSWPLSDQQGRHHGYTYPTYSWLPSIAPSNIDELVFPQEWKGDIMISSLSTQSLLRVRIVGGSVKFVESIFIGQRPRDFIQLPTGELVIFTDNQSIVELTPPSRKPKVAGGGQHTPKAELSPAVRSCIECHGVFLGSSNSSKISLWDILGRKIASTEYPGYSESLKNKGGRWTKQNLALFLRNPNSFASGTTMPDPGLGEGSIEQVIEYLETLQ